MLLIAMFGTLFVACSKKEEALDAAQEAINYMLQDVNGVNSTELHIDLDSVKVSDVEYITYTVEDTLYYAFKINASMVYNGENLGDKLYYYNVICKEPATVKKIDEPDYAAKEKQYLAKEVKKQYSAKDGSLKAKDVKKLLPDAKDALTKAIAAKKTNDGNGDNGDGNGNGGTEDPAVATLNTAASAVRAALIKAYADKAVTAETTQEALIALLPADYQYDVSDTELEQIVGGLDEKIYVRLPAMPADGYTSTTYKVTVYDKVNKVVLDVDQYGNVDINSIVAIIPEE
jgi:hypothetical protein